MCEACAPTTARLSRRSALSLLAAAPLAVAMSRRRSRERPSAVPVTPELSVMPREAWAGDRQPRSTMPAEDVRFLLVHHTAGGNRYTADEVPRIIREIYDFHTGPEKGWPDVCYNFFVDRFGGVWEGRAGSLAGPVTPDATGGNQGFAQLVCLLGDFTTEMPTDVAIESTVQALGWMARRFGIDTAPTATVQFESRGSNKWPVGQTVTAATVSGHRDMSATACPGDAFYPYVVTALREQVHAAAATAVPPAPPTVESTVTASQAATTVEDTTPPSSAPPTIAAPSVETGVTSDLPEPAPETSPVTSPPATTLPRP